MDLREKASETIRIVRRDFRWAKITYFLWGIVAGMLLSASIWFAPTLMAKFGSKKCPTWFVEYMKERHGTVQCVCDKQPDFVPKNRGTFGAVSYITGSGGTATENVGAGFMSHQFDLLKGKKFVEVRAFGPITEPESKYAKPVSVNGNVAVFTLNVADLLRKDYGSFNLTFKVTRPATAKEAALLAKDDRIPPYELNMSALEKGDRLILTIGDPRDHLFYVEKAAQGRRTLITYFLDKWYDANGNVKRQVASQVYLDLHDPKVEANQK